METKQLRIAKPCTVDWAGMTRADRGRFCADCKKVVRDLSSMSEREATETLRAETTSGLCVRFVYDRHGKVFFAGGDASLVAPSFLVRAKRAATVAALALPMALEACSPNPFDGGGGEMMGDVAFVETDSGSVGPGAFGDAAPDAPRKADATVSDGGLDASDPDADPDGGFVPPI